jgi:HD-GYP domain-containing protein (c-di-GMP phosphodiesterase class II)
MDAVEVRRAELIAAISLASDLGMGHPLETGLGTAVVASGISALLDLSGPDASRVRDLALLQHVGCTASADQTAQVMGDDVLMRQHAALLDFADKRAMGGFMLQHVRRAYPPLRRPAGFLKAVAGGQRLLGSAEEVCESAVMLSRRFGYDDAHLHDLECVYENWDGTGFPGGVAGEDITLAARIGSVALAATLAWRYGLDVVAHLRSRAGHTFDPALVDLVADHSDDLLAPLADEASLWEAATLPLGDDDGEADVDTTLRALADFVDLKSPSLHGHSSGVAALAADAGTVLGLATSEVTDLRRAGWVHDLGRVGVSAGIWAKPGRLTPHEREQVRLHPYLTQRVLHHAPSLARVAAIASAHHERLDGSGYHRGLTGAGLDLCARTLAAADAFRTRIEERPHRPALTSAGAATELREQAKAGLLDARAVDAVLTAAGERAGRPAQVAGLTPREVVTLQHAATGMSIRQIARAMTIAPKTVDGNLQRIYAKIGVSTRAGATLFALEHDLLGPATRPTGAGDGENSP